MSNGAGDPQRGAPLLFCGLHLEISRRSRADAVGRMTAVRSAKQCKAQFPFRDVVRWHVRGARSARTPVSLRGGVLAVDRTREADRLPPWRELFTCLQAAREPRRNSGRALRGGLYRHRCTASGSRSLLRSGDSTWDGMERRWLADFPCKLATGNGERLTSSLFSRDVCPSALWKPDDSCRSFALEAQMLRDESCKLFSEIAISFGVGLIKRRVQRQDA